MWWVTEKMREKFRAEGRQEVRDSVLKYELEIVGKTNDIRTLKTQVTNLQLVLKRFTDREFIDFSIGDPVPTDVEKRKAYVGAVAGLFHDILHPKLKHMIATSRAILENPENTAQQDSQLKGAIYAFWELIRWGNLLVGEDKANMVGLDPSSPTDKDNK